MTDVILHASNSKVSGVWHFVHRILTGEPLKHIAVQADGVVLEVCPTRGVRFVPADRWLRAVRPHMSVPIGAADVDWHDHQDLESLTVTPPWLMSVNHLLNRPSVNCVTVTQQLLTRLGFSVPDVRTPRGLLDWSINEQQPTSG